VCFEATPFKFKFEEKWRFNDAIEAIEP